MEKHSAAGPPLPKPKGQGDLQKREYIRRMLGALVVLTLGPAAWWSLRLAQADLEFRKGTAEGVARAAELAPLNTTYIALQALQFQDGGADAGLLLERIARTTPYASAPRIQLGLEAEAGGDLEAAERWLLDAARVDRQFEPRWTLANFYFRQQRSDAFWTWVRAALEVSYGDRDAAFDLCWKASPDAAEILRRGIPERHAVVAALLDYLTRKNRGDAAPVAIALAHGHDAGDVPALETAMDRLEMSGRLDQAREVWLGLGYPAPPTAGNLVLHPDFEAPRVGHGFDWRLSEEAGVKFTPFEAPPSLRISLNGMQPEACELLEQLVAVVKAKKYVLRWESRRVGDGSVNGVGWRVGPIRGAVNPHSDWSPGELPFVAARDGDSIRLEYTRPLGEPRAEGLIELRHVAVEEQR